MNDQNQRVLGLEEVSAWLAGVATNISLLACWLLATAAVRG